MDIGLTTKEQEEIVREVIDLFLIPKFKELGMDASGQWIKEVEARGNQIWGMDYTYWLAIGRKPNQDQSPEAIHSWVGWAGSTFLKDWVESKGLNINPYAVAYKIAREGTDYYPSGTDLLEVLESREVEEFIQKKVGQFIIPKVQLNIKRQFNG